MKLGSKKTFSFNSNETSSWVYQYLTGKAKNNFTLKRYSIENIPTTDDQHAGISFFINEDEVLRFIKKNETPVSVLIFNNDRAYEDLRKTSEIREHVNAILAAFEEVSIIPCIRLCLEFETGILFVINNQTQQKGPLHPDYNTGCEICLTKDEANGKIEFF